MGLLLVVNCRSRRGRESMNVLAGTRFGPMKTCCRSMRRREDILMREEICQRTHCIRRVLWVDLTFMTHVLNDHVIFGCITRMLDN